MWFQSPKIAPFEQGERKAFKGPRPEGSREQGEMKEVCTGPGTVERGGLSAAVGESRGLLSLLLGLLSRHAGAAWEKVGGFLTTCSPHCVHIHRQLRGPQVTATRALGRGRSSVRPSMTILRPKARGLTCSKNLPIGLS